MLKKLKKSCRILLLAAVFLFLMALSAAAVLWPPHRVGGTVTATSGSLEGCSAELDSGASQSVVAGLYLFEIPIYDADDNPDGIPIGTTLTVSIIKAGTPFAAKSFVVAAGETTRLDFNVAVPPDQYDLSTSVVGQGSVNPPAGTYDDGTDVALEAIPATGWVFDHWEGDVSGANPTTFVTMNGDKNVTACFMWISPPLCDLTVDVDGQGLVSPDSGTYDEGTTVNLVATPEPGWVFDHWEGDASGTTATVSVTMDIDKLITAYFTAARARSGGVDFADVDSAYREAIDGETIFIKGDTCSAGIPAALIFDRADHPALKLVGGCDCTFVPGNDATTLTSCLTISSGRITVEAIILK